MKVLQRDAERLLRFFKRPIYLVVFYFFIGLVFLGITGYSYFSQMNEEREVWISTRVAFWVLLIVFSGASIKVIVELMIPKYRRQYFRLINREKEKKQQR
jgi:hypothetical protein